MFLEQVAHFNNLSQQLRDELTNKINGFGKTVRYKFNISNKNPDPSKYNGEYVYPNMYTLDPTVFNIIDPYEKRDNVARSKKIGIVEQVNEKGLPEKFKKIRVEGKSKGILKLDIEGNEEHFYYAMFLELHPKLNGGKFSDKNKQQIFSRIDEKAHAQSERLIRTNKLKALNAAQAMSDKELVNFADAMQWDSSDEIELLRNQAEELAENDPDFFNDLVAGKKIEFQAAIKQAIDKNIISFDPAEYKFFWTGNKQPITVLSPVGEKSEVEKFAEFLQIGGQKADEIYKKIKGLLK